MGHKRPLADPGKSSAEGQPRGPSVQGSAGVGPGQGVTVVPHQDHRQCTGPGIRQGGSLRWSKLWLCWTQKAEWEYQGLSMTSLPPAEFPVSATWLTASGRTNCLSSSFPVLFCWQCSPMSVVHNEVIVSPSALMNVAEDRLPLSSSERVYQPASHGEMAFFWVFSCSAVEGKSMHASEFSSVSN